MVIVSRSLFVQQRARRIVRSFGIEDRLLDAAEAANPGLEWQQVVNALDRVFLSHGGAMGQVSFLHSPSQTLTGRTPLEAIAEPEGPSKIRDAARAFSART